MPRRPRSLNPTCYLNREAVRDALLEAAKTRYNKFSRVSSETLERINNVVRREVYSTVRSLPSRGKTI